MVCLRGCHLGWIRVNLGQLVKCGGMVIITVTCGLLHLLGHLGWSIVDRWSGICKLHYNLHHLQLMLPIELCLLSLEPEKFGLSFFLRLNHGFRPFLLLLTKGTKGLCHLLHSLCLTSCSFFKARFHLKLGFFCFLLVPQELLLVSLLISSAESQLSSALSWLLLVFGRSLSPSSSEDEDAVGDRTSLGLEAASISPMVSEKIGFKMVNHSGSSIDAFPLPIFTRSVNFRHCFLRNLYLIRSLAGLMSNGLFFCLPLDLLFSRSFSSLNSSDKSNFSKSFEISSKTWLFEDFFKASVSSRTAYCFFSSASTSARYFISAFVHTRSFLDFLGWYKPSFDLSAILNW